MRYKYYQIESYEIEEDPDSLTIYLPSITVTSGSPPSDDRLDYKKLGGFWERSANSKYYDFLKINDALYRRVGKGNIVDPIHGNQGPYLFVLPETHPGYNFDIYYYFCCTAYVQPLNEYYNDDDIIAIVTNTFPDFVAANKE